MNTAEQINSVIDNICEKIGVGVDSAAQLVPQLAKYRIVSISIWALLFLFLAIFTTSTARDLISKKEKDEDFLGLGIVCYAIAIGCLIVCTALAANAIGWVVAPDVKAIEYMINMLDM